MQTPLPTVPLFHELLGFRLKIIFAFLALFLWPCYKAPACFTARHIRGANALKMISFLHGKVVEALPTQVTVDVHGIGYDVLIPLSSFDKLPAPGNEVKLLTHLAVRED